MARKPVDLKAAKAAKQKKIAIGGGVLLVALLAFSIPRTLKMLHHSPQASSMHHVRSSQGTPGSSTAPSSALPPGVPSNVVSTAGTTGTTVLTAQLAPPARQGQLSSLSKSFNSKDPFEQLIDDSAVSDSGQTPPADTTAKPTKPTKPGPELKVVPNTTAPAPVAQAAPTAKKVVLPFLSAVISVNGVRWGVNVKLDFPSDAPLFTLVSLKKGTAKVSVAGGSLANGAPTLTLRRGKPVTLVNTADGTRYRLVLVSLSTASAATPPTEDAAAAGQTSTSTTARAQTTTTQTTTTGPTLGG